MSKIFVVEDDRALRLGLCDLLKKNGYQAVTTDDFEGILGHIGQAEADLILLDLHLPHVDGYYICRELRKTSQVPIVVLTSQNSDLDELMSINLGADDFISKPYKPQILLARIDNILRRTQRTSPSINHGGVTLNMANSSISFQGREESLSKNEYIILYTLMTQTGTIVSRNALMEALWQSDAFIDDNTLTVNINRLRKKLEAMGIVDFLITKRGQGYSVC